MSEADKEMKGLQTETSSVKNDDKQKDLIHNFSSQEKPKFSVDLGLSLGGFPWESSGEEKEVEASPPLSWAIDSASRRKGHEVLPQRSLLRPRRVSMKRQARSRRRRGSIAYGRRYQYPVLASTSYGRPTAEMIMFEDILSSSSNKRPADGIKFHNPLVSNSNGEPLHDSAGINSKGKAAEFVGTMVYTAAASSNSSGKPVEFAGRQLENEADSSSSKVANPELDVKVLMKMPIVKSKVGRQVEGFLYKYKRGEVSMVCSCHGYLLNPTEFLKHAGATDLSNPLKHISVMPFNL
ncbi:ninja-family protein Os03g0419100-like [Euphorbia lathyris]|uniref:ninja-family protein Os03g0419100-like n=1 Tax=Euphorbia lathyris TaxID=212925 RepID=UPI00331382E3